MSKKLKEIIGFEATASYNSKEDAVKDLQEAGAELVQSPRGGPDYWNLDGTALTVSTNPETGKTKVRDIS